MTNTNNDGGDDAEAKSNDTAIVTKREEVLNAVIETFQKEFLPCLKKQKEEMGDIEGAVVGETYDTGKLIKFLNSKFQIPGIWNVEFKFFFEYFGFRFA